MYHASNASSPLTSPTVQSSSDSFFSSAYRDPPLIKPAMGQAESAVKQPELATQEAPLLPQTTSKYRFAWPGRRRKSEEFTKVTSAPMPSPSRTTAPPPSSFDNKTNGRELSRQESNVPSIDSHTSELSRPPSRASSAKQLTLQFASNTLMALKGRLNASQASIHSLRTSSATSPTTPPPPLPPKPDMSLLSASSSTSSHSENSSRDWVSLERSSKPLPLPTPDASAPVSVIETRPENRIIPTATASSSEHDVNQPQRRGRERREDTNLHAADDWRKSDSTLRTVRLVGSRTPRPLSLAESTNSGQTVLPSVGGAGSSAANLGASKRWSALMTDVDFGLKEVDSEDDEDDDEVVASVPPSAFNSVHNLQKQAPSPSSSRSSSPASASSKPEPTHRRSSLSIRIARFSGSKARVSDQGHLSGSDSEALSSSVSTRGTGLDMGMCTANSSSTSITSSSVGVGAKDSRPSIELASSASIASDLSAERRPHQYAQYKANAKLEPWISLSSTNNSASDSQASLSTSESASTSSHTGSLNRHPDAEKSGMHATNTSPPRGSTLRPAHQRTRLQSIQARGFRQTAVSITTGFAPAAGFARKAVDRLGRALGGSSGANADADQLPAGHGNGFVQGHAHSTSASNALLLGMTGQSHQYQPHQDDRLHSGHGHGHLQPQHPPSAAKKAMRRHGASPSGSWSITSNSASLSDTDGGPAGPRLGRCLRGPLVAPNEGKGLVFGRELILCVNDTACDGTVESGADDLALEGRSLPALVVRCAQHIVKWGVQEEGLFRISGRSTHISRLRAEFDVGADYDLRECGPGEIDPHAVASIFKAYLRELPEPLVTRHLMPYFDAALSAENSMINAADAQSTAGGNHNGFERMRGPGLPSGPRDSLQVRKAPSLSTFAVPALSPRTASPDLLNTLSALIARLPKENRDLLRTVTELISATARASRETKMPLSNLLLVFCPSLVMSPPLLRVLCEGKGIWDGPLEGVKLTPVLAELPDNATKIDEDDEENETGRRSREGEAGLHSQRTIRRSPRGSSEASSAKANSKEDIAEIGATVTPPVVLPSLVLPSGDGNSSVASAHTKTDSSICASINLSSPGELTHSSNSSDSLHTPPSSNSGSVSPNASLAPSALMMKSAIDTTGLTNKIFALRAQSDLPSPLSPSTVKKAVRKSLIGNPVPFPLGLKISRSVSGNSSPGSAPVTPIELGGSDKFSSTSHSSSSPNLTRDVALGSGGGTPPRLGRRKSKASLLGLKSKRSLSSLLGLAQAQTPREGIPDSTAEDLDRAPRSSTPCPVLELPVDTSRILFGLGVPLTDEPEPSPLTEAPSALRIPSQSPSPSLSPSSSLRPQGTSMDRAESDSSAITNSMFYTPPTTTRALAPANSLSTASSSSSGTHSFLDFNLGKSEDEEDWAKSVLKAAVSDA